MIYIKNKLKTKLIGKLMEIGISSEKDILNMQIEDLLKIPNLTIIDIYILVGFRIAIKNKEQGFLAYWAKNDEKEKEDYINGI